MMHHVTLASSNTVIATKPGKQTAELAEHVRNRKETWQQGKPRCAEPPLHGRLLISFMLHLNLGCIINSFVFQVRELRGSEGGSAQGCSEDWEK